MMRLSTGDCTGTLTGFWSVREGVYIMRAACAGHHKDPNRYRRGYTGVLIRGNLRYYMVLDGRK